MKVEIRLATTQSTAAAVSQIRSSPQCWDRATLNPLNVYAGHTIDPSWLKVDIDPSWLKVDQLRRTARPVARSDRVSLASMPLSYLLTVLSRFLP
jgi:hypothetical protein